MPNGATGYSLIWSASPGAFRMQCGIWCSNDYLGIGLRHLKASNWERERHQERAARTKAVLTAAALPVMTSPTHIVPVFVGDPERCKQASDLLLGEHGIYIQPINYPTVPKGKERLRINAGRSLGRRLAAVGTTVQAARARGRVNLLL